MAQPLPTRSRTCLRQDHGSCPHFAGLERPPSLWRPWQWRAELGYVVCDCDCHSVCPLAGERTVPKERWRERCTCPGGARVRAGQDRAEELKRDLAAVATELRSSGRWDAEEIERRLGEVYRSHGEGMPPGLAGWSRLLATANARKGTRLPRLLWMAARGTGGVVTWAWSGPAGPDAQTEHNRAEARAGFRSIGVMVAVAVIVTAGASRSSGWTRRLGVGVAVVIWLVTGWAGVLVTGVTALSRVAERERGSLADERDAGS